MNHPDYGLDDTSLRSSFFEQLVEHTFISEVLQEVYFGYGLVVEVLRAEVDASGYDLVLECNGILRHVQLKTSKDRAKTSSQKVHLRLGEKASGCVVWVIRKEDPESRRMKLSYRYFGGLAGEPLPALQSFKIATHTKGDAKGVKNERPMIRVVPKSRFIGLETSGELVAILFGLKIKPN